MKKYDLTKPNRAKKATRMKKTDGLPLYFTKVLRVGTDGKPNYVKVMPVSKALKLLDPKHYKGTRGYKFIGRD